MFVLFLSDPRSPYERGMVLLMKIYLFERIFERNDYYTYHDYYSLSLGGEGEGSYR